MLITNLPSASVCMSIAWVLVMFSLVREMRDCCANQQCNVSMENLNVFKNRSGRSVFWVPLGFK